MIHLSHAAAHQSVAHYTPILNFCSTDSTHVILILCLHHVAHVTHEGGLPFSLRLVTLTLMGLSLLQPRMAEDGVERGALVGLGVQHAAKQVPGLGR